MLYAAGTNPCRVNCKDRIILEKCTLPPGDLARITVGRNFSANEWKVYFPGEKYRKTLTDYQVQTRRRRQEEIEEIEASRRVNHYPKAHPCADPAKRSNMVAKHILEQFSITKSIIRSALHLRGSAVRTAAQLRTAGSTSTLWKAILRHRCMLPADMTKSFLRR